MPAQGETILDCLGLAGSFVKGIGRFSTIALRTTYLSLAGVGQVNLDRETLALELRPLAQIAGSRGFGSCVVEGPFRDIKGRLCYPPR